MKFEKVLVTGAAGFIGFHVCQRLLAEGRQVVGIDNVNDYYDPLLKEARLALLQLQNRFQFHRIGLEDREAHESVVRAFQPDAYVNLAAQAGVRYSLENPHAYAQSNLLGFLNVLEACRNSNIQHLVYASSSSVYGCNTKMPFSVHDNVDHPISFYAATKKSNELMAHSYSHLFGIPTTGLRFFTVYGPWGRPDMALFLFTKAILEGKPIDVFNNGQMKRDFTYIDDIVDGVIATIDHVATPNLNWNSEAPDPSSSKAPYRLYNIGNDQPVELLRMIEVLEDALGKPAKKNFLPMQPGDVLATWADIVSLTEAVGYKPSTTIEIGIPRFVEWYRGYYGV